MPDRVRHDVLGGFRGVTRRFRSCHLLSYAVIPAVSRYPEPWRYQRVAVLGL